MYPQRLRWSRSKFSDFGAPSPRCGHTAVCIGQSKVVFFGGFVQDEERYLNDILAYDIGSRLLYTPNCSGNGQAGPCPRAFHVSVGIGRNVFVIGGRSRDRSLNDVWVLDTDVWQWSELDVFGDVPCPREFSAASAIGNDKIIMFGGWQSKGRLSDLYLFNTRTLEWKEITVAGLVPPPRCGHTAAVIDDKLMIYGGRNESILGDLWVLNGIVEEGEGAPAWTKINLPGQYLFPRCGHSMISGENYLLLFGGNADEGWSNKCIILYKSTQWTFLRTCKESPCPRSYHSMTCIGPGFLLFGGCDGKNTFADLWWLVIEDDPHIGLDTNDYAELSVLKEMAGANLDSISLVGSCDPRIEAYIFKHFQQILYMAWFSWRKKPFHDMHITPPPRWQLRGDCAYEATCTVIECHFKMVYASRPPGQVRVFNVRLSAMHVKQMVHDYMHSKEGENAKLGDKLAICLLMAMRYGIVSEADWAAGCPPEAVRYKIKAYRQLSDIQKKKKIPKLLEKCEAIVTTFKVTNEYLSLLPHDIYRYRAPDDLNGVIDLHERHCVVLTSTGYEFKEPDTTGAEDLQQTAAIKPPETYFEYMNSYSSGWGKDGCGHIYEDV